MFIIRQAKLDDMGTLLKLAKMVHFINLPPDKDVINNKIVHSQKSFQRTAWGEPVPEWTPTKIVSGLAQSVARSDLYMFVMEDTESPGCLGTSQLISRMGGPGDPNYCFKLERRERFSESLKHGHTSIVARLYEDESGPTEIGGLILQPSFRHHPAKLGRFIAMIRFHFIGLHRRRFRDTILAEMMAPITADGNNLLWDCLGRRFIPLSYTEADRFCQYSREFIPALMPRGDIYLSLLPPEARNVIGEVGPETVPARRMLEKLGFEYRHLVDPFDGGPFLHADTDQIGVVRDTRLMPLGEAIEADEGDCEGFVSYLDSDGHFAAVQEPFTVDADGVVRTTEQAMRALEVSPGAEVGVTVLQRHGPEPTKKRSRKKPAPKPRSRKKAKA